jgi:type III secretion system FlhB-like substrate exporter
MVDRVVERAVEYEVPIYKDVEVIKYVDVPETIYKDVPYEVPRIVEVTKEVEYRKEV